MEIRERELQVSLPKRESVATAASVVVEERESVATATSVPATAASVTAKERERVVTAGSVAAIERVCCHCSECSHYHECPCHCQECRCHRKRVLPLPGVSLPKRESVATVVSVAAKERECLLISTIAD